MAGLAALGLLLSCASPEPNPEATLPLVALSPPADQLPIDGLWAAVDDASRVVQVDRGRVYVGHGAGTGVTPGSLLHTQIVQTGPREYECQAPRTRGAEIVWLDCELTLEPGGRLVATTSPSRRPDDPVRPEIVSYEPLALADPIWFDAQRESSEVVSAEDAHPPLPPLAPIVVRVEPEPRPEPPAPELEPVPAPVVIADSPPGSYRALVIGSGDYLYMPAVATAEVDADAIARTLEELYGFEITNLRNPTLRQMLDALHAERDSLAPDDKLLIYYAGQGLISGGRCTWFPVDATGDDPNEGLANEEIREVLQQIKANLVMVVADSCFTAATRREARLAADDFAALSQSRTRVVLSSGGIEPLQDGSGDGHSVFSGAVVQALRGNTGPLAGTGLFEEIQRIIPEGGSQSPEYSDIVGTGHDGGDFLFLPINLDR